MATRSARPALSDAAHRVAEHATALARLEVRLAVREMREKSRRFLVAGGVLGGAGGLALLALTTAYAAGIAGLALVVPVWEALLIAGGRGAARRHAARSRAGGIGATVRLMLRISREGRVVAELGRFALVRRR